MYWLIRSYHSLCVFASADPSLQSRPPLGSCTCPSFIIVCRRDLFCSWRVAVMEQWVTCCCHRNSSIQRVRNSRRAADQVLSGSKPHSLFLSCLRWFTKPTPRPGEEVLVDAFFSAAVESACQFSEDFNGWTFFFLFFKPFGSEQISTLRARRKPLT